MAKRISYRYHTYTSGQSHLIRWSFAMLDIHKVGVTYRAGYFNDSDGVFLEVKDGQRFLVLRSSTTGTVTEERVPQDQWNGDAFRNSAMTLEALDATGASKLAVVAFIEMQWYGSGRVRCGFIGPDGNRLVLHEFKNAFAHSRPYMSTATLPLTFELFNHDTTDTPSLTRLIAASVETSGEKPWNHAIYALTNPAPITVTNGNSKMLYAIGLKDLYYGKPNRIGIGGGDLNISCKTAVGTGAVLRLNFWVGRGPSGYPGVTFTNHPHPLSAATVAVGDYPAPTADATNYIFFSQLVQANSNGVVTRIPYSDIVEPIKTELRRAPDNTWSMISALSVECLYPGDSVDIFFTVQWLEIK